MNYLPDAALFLVLTISLVVAGWCLTPVSRSSFEATFIPGAALLGLLGWLVWSVGFLSLMPSFWLIMPWPLLLALIFWKRTNLVTHAGRSFRGLKSLDGIDGAFVFYLLFLFGLAFALTLAPPTGTDYDSLTYHLAVPAQYLRAGKVVELNYDHHSYFPFTLEMLYALGLAARGAVFAKLFHWLMLPIGALALVAIGKRAHSARVGLIAAALYASMPMVLQEASTAYIDLGFSAFAFLAVLCFCGAPSREHGQNWLWCGAFCGFCLGTKYFGALVFGFLGIWFLLEGRRVSVESVPVDGEVSRKLNWRHLALYAIPALVFGAPWYIRNVLWTGSPVFPFAYSLFGGAGWTSEMAVKYDASQAIYGFGKSLPDLILLPWRLAMTPLNAGVFNTGVKGQPFWPLIPGPIADPQQGLFEVQGLFVNIFPGPTLFALGIPALFLRGKPREVALCAWFFGFLWFFWAFTSQQIRYLLPALGLLALVSGWGAVEMAPRLRMTRAVGGLFLTLWLLFSPALTLWRARSNFAVLTGATSGETYLRRSFAAYDAMSYANQNTPQDAKFAVYGEPRCFYLDRAYFWADQGHNTLIDYTKLKDGAALTKALRDLGATHLLCNFDSARNGGVFDPPQPFVDQAVADGNLTLLFESHGYRVYRIAT
jgi:4-amino-4-deoxy-L-arabinose transferase-like glycosyltransferase